MKKYKLPNGMIVLYEKKDTETVTIEIMVKVGSNNETKQIAGISHFVEHMLFEGTKKRTTNQIIANEIERLGGDVNAYTTNERTAYYIKVPKKHYAIALDILSDIIQRSTFDKKFVEKEREIILKEINMVTDQPRFHQWIVFYKTLFKNHPSKNPTYGTKEAVRKMTRDDLISYYNKHYLPNNMIVSVVGNSSDPLPSINKAFGFFQKGMLITATRIREPENSKQMKIENKKILNSYMVLGYKTAQRVHPDSYVLDVITAIFSRGQSGRIVEEIRTKRGLAYECNVNHEPSTDYGVFAVYLSTDKKNIPVAKKIILQEFRKLRNLTKKDIKDAKGYLEGKTILEEEDTHHVADELNFWELIEDAKLHKEYLKKIRQVTKGDIVRVAKKYLNDKYTMIVLMQK